MITVVKLGGSLLATETLPACLQATMSLPGRVVVVTGGGRFADLVRDQQLSLGFDQIAAHRMAILAMQQTALLCHGLLPQFSLRASVAEILLGSEKMLWLPDWRELDAAAIPASWAITSDSLAAWLAGRIDAGRLIIVKAGKVDPEADLPQLQAQGLLDSAFLDFAKPIRQRISVFHHQQFLSLPCSS